MPAMKFIVSVSVAILAIHLQCVEAQGTVACRLPLTYNAQTTNAGSNVYNTLGVAGATCDATCTQGGQACAGDTNSDVQCAVAVDSLCSSLADGTTASAEGQANLLALGNAICPTITTTTATAQVPAAANQPASFPNPAFLAGSNAGLNTAVVGLQGADPWTCTVAPPAANSPICACRTNAVAQSDALALCTCAHFGVPTGAPTGIPTTAPTAVVTNAPTDSSSWTVTSNDDSMSGGAIAGIVIGSIVGAALVIGAGVMIGTK